MNNRPFRLIFKRSQSPGPSPTFLLTVAAEMTSDFIEAAQYYGIWSDIIYADPKLEEAREMRARQSELKAKKNRKRMRRFVNSLSGEMAFFALPLYLTYRITKFIYIGPFKLIWWFYCALKTQNTQIMRFYELIPGKTITTHTLDEALEAEQLILQTTEVMEAYITQALNYSGEAFEASPTD